jgi:hypothetical protein
MFNGSSIEVRHFYFNDTFLSYYEVFCRCGGKREEPTEHVSPVRITIRRIMPKFSHDVKERKEHQGSRCVPVSAKISGISEPKSINDRWTLNFGHHECFSFDAATQS